MFVVDKLNY